MTVYIDELVPRPDAKHSIFRPGSCHLTADTDEELHAFAARIGLKRDWYQPHQLANHYDLTRGTRAAAEAAGAVFMSAREQAERRIAARENLCPGCRNKLPSKDGRGYSSAWSHPCPGGCDHLWHGLCPVCRCWVEELRAAQSSEVQDMPAIDAALGWSRLVPPPAAPAGRPAPTPWPLTRAVRTLSIRQPWVWAIFHGEKRRPDQPRTERIENRDWKNCHVRGPLLIHVGGGCTKEEYESGVESIRIMREDLGLPEIEVPPLSELPRGGLCGVARLVGADHHPAVIDVPESSPWSKGYVGFGLAGALGLRLADVRELPLIPAKGSLNFFFVTLAGLTGVEAYAAALGEMEAQ